MSVAIFLHYVRLRMRERMEYRGAFLLGLASQMLGYAASYLVIWLTLQRFRMIGGWDWPEIAFLYSLNVLTYALGAAFAYSPMYGLEEMVRKGTFDAVLVRPWDPFLSLIAQAFNVGYVGHVVLSGGILTWAVTRLDVGWTPLTVAFLVGSVLSGMCIQAAGLTLIGAWTFTQVRSDVLFWFYGSLRQFQNYPIPIFATAIQVVLTAAIPLAFTSFYPAMILLEKDAGAMPAWIGWLSPFIGPPVLWGAYRLWMRGVDRYLGAGG